ncbi:phage terminase large subunit family protein [Ensifer adhaerens]|uniref:phage terminase large subunit family protein n=1 Tax=Ensifer adhaerens TaxID=106592 RepID=UPI001CBF06A9|nr:terminase gpA endonuclease subunit [Ensifer adhaerens]MBZ7923118.1 phage terminase large subunit family protein [Ensifer adhaerens]UAX91708.1 phage terminase large subunit family protein [Ensifer adhaerens]UAX99336.1 phage terminase large subunit family protein [Ensifer adhaerens]UAY06719.1 phage terminase large subunit family protein [Ensifer adhaerens]
MHIALKRSAVAVIAATLAAAIMPPEKVDAVQYARNNVVVPDGPRSGDTWDDSLTPHIREPLLMTMVESGHNEIAVRKSAQTGFTTLLLCSAAYTIAQDPCRMMIVQPTTNALAEFNREKLTVMLQQSKALKKLVRDQTSRSGEGSTALAKRFPGGSLKLAIANSAADLRSSTIKKAFCDEIDEYPDDLDGQGDPFGMIEARQESFLASGDWFRAYVSTPTVKGSSKIDDKFMAGDQRYWNMPCPGCGAHFKFEFDRRYFKFNDAFPHDPYYATPCCGSIVQSHEKVSLYRKGKWIAEASRPGAYPSYHFDALTSPFVPWEKIAERFVACNGDPQKLKTFFNLTLGLPFDMKGDAPDHVRLMERRETGLKRGHIPAQGIVFVGTADVQMNGIWYLFKAWGPDRQSWRVDAGYIEGATDDPHGGAFLKLEELRSKEWPDAFGRTRKVDAFGVDTGYRSHVVYTWCRGKAGVFALDGLDGWSRPPIGQPKAMDINFNGKRIRNGVMLWGVGTWSIKGAFYANLRKEGRAAGKDADPPGYCHFGDWMDEIYFKQITSEYLGTEKFKGRSRQKWIPRVGYENHLLDCEVYGEALGDYLGIARMTPDEWQRLIAMRGVPEQVFTQDLFAPAPLVAQAASAASVAPTPVAENDDLDEVSEGDSAAVSMTRTRDPDEFGDRDYDF